MKTGPRLKKSILFIHRWLGLFTGLVVFIVAVTGAIYCFAPELQNATQPYRFVKGQDKPFLLPSQIKAIAEKQLPGKPAKRIAFGGKDKAAYVLFFGKAPAYYYSVFINPYSGEVLKVKNMRRDFFTIVLYLHMTLLVPYGDVIVQWCTLIFLFMLISGIVLWWPRNRGARKSRYAVKWGASPKRLNYDLHNVLGFYASWIAIFITITGLIWSFEWFANGIYNLTGAKHSIIQKKAPLSDTAALAAAGSETIDLVWLVLQQDMQAKYVKAEMLLPQNKQAAVTVRASPEAGTYYKADFRYFDQYTGHEIPGAYVWGKYSDAHTMADKIKRMNYDIHVGAILGWPGRIAAFLAALVIASLPVTGFIMYRGRKKKRRMPKGERLMSNAQRVTQKAECRLEVVSDK